KTFADVVGFMNVGMCVIGDRLGLFKDLAKNGPATSSELAARLGIVERYTREWLSQMACAEYLLYDPTNQRFSLPASHAPILAEEGSPEFLGGIYQNFQCIDAGIFSKLIRSFREGGGIAYSEYNADYWDGLDRYTTSGLKRNLVQKYIPAMPEVLAALERGALVADVGCGRGGMLLMLAEAFPHSRFIGYDAFEANIIQAQANAQSAGVTERLNYVHLNATHGLPQKYDVILCFDSLHHSTDVPDFMHTIHEALNPGGIFVCSEASCAETLEGNIGPGGAMLFASSVFVCVPQVLSESDEAFGLAGITFSKMRQLAATAGFDEPRLVPLENSGNNIYEIKR
ncbi:MAG: hypothetical protein A2Y88_05315, partial [Chloroflexi bacterium RBG_13_48_10]